VHSRPADFLAIQADLFGGCRFWGRASATTTAALTNALNAARTPSHDQHDCDDGRTPTDDGHGYGFDDEDGDGGMGLGWVETTERSRSNAAALKTLCDSFLAQDYRGTPRPLFVLHLQPGHTPTVEGRIETNLHGIPPTIEAGLVEILATDADVRAVLFDGKRPLAVSTQVNAADTPAKTKFAVRARDMGDRFPGSTDPTVDCEIHHIRPRSNHGDHHPDNLITLGRRRHRPLIHQRRWRQHLDPDTGIYTIQRAGRTFRSLPHTTPLQPDPGPPDPPDTGSDGDGGLDPPRLWDHHPPPNPPPDPPDGPGP
jgi:hypothetical protein